MSADGNVVAVVLSRSRNITVFHHVHDAWEQIDIFEVDDIDATPMDDFLRVEALLGDDSLVANGIAHGFLHLFHMTKSEYVQIGQDVMADGIDSYTMEMCSSRPLAGP